MNTTALPLRRRIGPALTLMFLAPLIAEVLPTTDLSLHTPRIKAHKPALLAAVRLREQIVAAATVSPEHFNRADYDTLWQLWHAHDVKEPSNP